MFFQFDMFSLEHRPSLDYVLLKNIINCIYYDLCLDWRDYGKLVTSVCGIVARQSLCACVCVWKCI